MTESEAAPDIPVLVPARELAELRRHAPRAWRPIETAPKDGTNFLAIYGVDDDGTYWIVFWNGRHFECVSGGYQVDHATHWQPLPPVLSPCPKCGRETCGCTGSETPQPVCTEDDGSREPVYPSQIEANEAMRSALSSADDPILSPFAAHEAAIDQLREENARLRAAVTSTERGGAA